MKNSFLRYKIIEIFGIGNFDGLISAEFVKMCGRRLRELVSSRIPEPKYNMPIATRLNIIFYITLVIL